MAARPQREIAARAPTPPDPFGGLHLNGTSVTANFYFAPPPGMLPLSGRQAAVLSVVVAYHSAIDEPCPCRLVARKLGIHHEAVRGHYAVLYRKGWLLSESSPATPSVPFLAGRSER